MSSIWRYSCDCGGTFDTHADPKEVDFEAVYGPVKCRRCGKNFPTDRAERYAVDADGRATKGEE